MACFVRNASVMARFVVLDHSLIGVGGHHYEQAVQILQAADRLGLEPVLAANMRFTQRQLLPPHWQVLTVFADESHDCLADYPLDTRGLPLSTGGPEAGTQPAERWPRVGLDAVRQKWRSYQHRRRTERFAWGCAAIHAQIALQGGDHVFIPTTSLFDLLGLARSCKRTKASAKSCGMGCFTTASCRGASRSMPNKRRWNARSVVNSNTCCSISRAGDCDSMAPRKDWPSNTIACLLSEFEVLPFPVDAHALRGTELPATSRKLRLTCAGFLRREKGKVLASRFVEGLWSNELAAGHMQLVVQTNRRQALRMLPRNAVVPMDFKSALSDTDTDPIVWLRHPLTREAYIDLIRQSDMAVFLHEDRAYYTRCSGVLVEMLAGGVPVLVPAGSWLADQVSESIYEHLDGLRSTAPDGRPCHHRSCDGKNRSPGDGRQRTSAVRRRRRMPLRIGNSHGNLRGHGQLPVARSRVSGDLPAIGR